MFISYWFKLYFKDFCLLFSSCQKLVLVTHIARDPSLLHYSSTGFVTALTLVFVTVGQKAHGKCIWPPWWFRVRAVFSKVDFRRTAIIFRSGPTNWSIVSMVDNNSDNVPFLKPIEQSTEATAPMKCCYFVERTLRYTWFMLGSCASGGTQKYWEYDPWLFHLPRAWRMP